MIYSAGDVVFIAKSQLGLNDGRRYGAKAGEAWCAYFLHWCAVQAGLKKDVIPCLPWCDNLRDHYRKLGLWRLKEERTPRIGDIICFGWDSETDHVHHVGFVSGVDEMFVYTVEGNSGDRRAVCEWKYPLMSPYILGYCRPRYTGETPKKEEKPQIKNVNMGTFEEPASPSRYQSGTGTAPVASALSITIRTGDATFTPRVLSGVRLTLQSRGAPSALTFEVLPGGNAFYEGSKVIASADGKTIFVGYVFTKSRDMDGIIRVTAYDQLRYFKMREFYERGKTTASETLQEICRLHGLSVGEIEKTPGVLLGKLYDNLTLFDIMEDVLAETELSCGVRYLLADEAGKITLKKPWECGVKITSDHVRSLQYSSSIENMINRIKAITELETERQITVVEDPHSIGRYGLLQDVEKQDTRNIDEVRALLRKRNKVHRALRMTADGDIRVRAGTLLDVDLTLGDTVMTGLLTVARVTHVWDGGDHTMELVLEGGDFDA